jgi:hypothetical protein
VLSVVAMLLAAAPALPPECELPETRDVAVLSKLSKLDGTLSASLDAVATWCFDSSGAWSSGLKPKQGVAARESEPVGECKKAISACESAQAALMAALEWRGLAKAALLDFDRPYRGQKYAPKRTGLRETPNEAADCSARSRTDLFAMAQSRMDVARLMSLIQSEYANYKTWLYKGSLVCRNELKAAKKDPTRASVAVDKPNAPVLPGSAPAAGGREGEVASGPPTASGKTEPAATAAPGGHSGAAAAATTADAGRAAVVAAAGPGVGTAAAAADAGAAAAAPTEKPRAVALAIPVALPPEGPPPAASAGAPSRDAEVEAMLVRWRSYAARQAENEKDRDYTLGFLASREVRACRCSRVNAAAVVRALEHREGGETGLALLRADDAANTRCVECGLDAFGPWKSRSTKQCALVDGLTDYEISRLGASDDANGIPPRCFDDVLRARAAKAAKADAGRPVVALQVAQPAVTGTLTPMPAPQPQPVAQPTARPQPAGQPNAQPQPQGQPVASSGQAVPGGGNYGPPMTGPGVPAGGYDAFVPPAGFAPSIPREDGRMYVRLSMSATCTAEINPGPIQARTGDLLLVPFAARQLSVKSPCGGLAEIYWGREARPRFSEVFGRNQPLVFNFKAQ